MDVRDLRGKSALITGAASGIGKETALALARVGADLFLCDVDEAGLKAVEETARSMGRTVLARPTDVSSRHEMATFADDVHAKREAVDILVNNAGVALGGDFLQTPLDDWDWIVGINLKGVVHGCHLFVPRMVQRGRGGHVVNVASMAAFLPIPPFCAYNATKAAVVSLSESLRGELATHGIGVTAICPGIIRTAIADHMLVPEGEEGAKARATARSLMDRRNYGPDRVARGILKAIQRNRSVAPVSPEAWIAYALKRIAPGLVLSTLRLATDRARKQLEATKTS